MSSLISVIESPINGETVPAVNARDLHAFLENKEHFSQWIKQRIEQYGFVENQDFVTFSENTEKGRPRVEYAVTLDMAKELAMVERNQKGKEARQYFIACEKQLREKSTYIVPRAQSSAIEAAKWIHQILPNLGETSLQELISRATRIDFGEPLLPLPKIEEKFYTATELAEFLGVSANKIGRLANAYGLKIPAYGEYRLSKSRHGGKQVEQFFYNKEGHQALAEALEVRHAC